MSESDDYDDPAVEEAWCAQRRAEVAAYLERQGAVHGRIGEWPAWHIAPYVSIWAIESVQSPGWVGWWAICGDLPIDYMTAGKIRHPREALRGFSRSWSDLASRMARGEADPENAIGPPEKWPELAPLLEVRARLLSEFAGDDSLWEDAP
jgi:hypothetical protein